MPEYYLRVLGKETVIKRMVAEDHEVAMRAAIQWHGQNPDMDLTCGVQRIAVRRASVWLLRPDAGCEDGKDSARDAIDSFTVAAGWTSSAQRTSDSLGVDVTAKAQKTELEPSWLGPKLSNWLRGLL
jgi:hypothetical protein